MRLIERLGMYRLLENPRVYNAVQRMFSVGGDQQVRRLFGDYVDSEPCDSVLELGCGTGAWSVTHHKTFVRTDLNDRYFPQAVSAGVKYLKMDAADLSAFENGSFDLVYSMGLYHHLPDEAVLLSLWESARILRPHGRVVVFDAILPTRPWRVLAWVSRKLDRGHWVRSEARTSALVEQAGLTIRRQRRCQWGILRLEGCCWDCIA